MSGVTSVLSSAQITSLIQQASTAYQAPATALQSQEQPIQTQISALGSVQSALSSLQSALGGLADVQSLAQFSATTSSSGTVSATVTNDASSRDLQSVEYSACAGAEPDFLRFRQRQFEPGRRIDRNSSRQRTGRDRKHCQRPGQFDRDRQRDQSGQCRGAGDSRLRRQLISPYR